MAPLEALAPIADALAVPDDDRRVHAALRAAFGDALRAALLDNEGRETRARLAALLTEAKRSPISRLEVLLAAEGHLADVAAESDALVAELMATAPPMRARYLALGALGELARAGDHAAVARISDAMARDAEWPVRARAAELGAGLAGAQEALVGAVRDPEPRVREASLQSLALMVPQGAVEAAKQAVANDGWAFVRAQAVGVLARAPFSADVENALGKALRDPSARVRAAVLVALGRRRATSWRNAIRERLEDRDEDVEVRAAAAQALGATCDAGSAERLTDFAHLLVVPGVPEELLQVAVGSLAGLAARQPSDLKARQAPLLAPAVPLPPCGPRPSARWPFAGPAAELISR